MKQISVIGCGAMGTCIANLLSENIQKFEDYNHKVLLHVRDEEFNGKRLIDVIRNTRENMKYAPNVKLNDSVEVHCDVKFIAAISDIIIFVYATRHVNEILQELKGNLKPNVLFISFSKGLLVSEETAIIPDNIVRLVSEEIIRVTKSKCVVVSGGVNAKGLARGDFAEATLGGLDPVVTHEVKRLLEGPKLLITCTKDMITVELCGALKNILVVAAGIANGLKLGANTKSAIIRLGLFEIGQYCKFMYAKYDTSMSTLLQSCGISELFLCMLHRKDEIPSVGDDFDFFNLIIGNMLTQEEYMQMSLVEIEHQLHPDLVSSGPDCARKIHMQLKSLELTHDYPLFTAIHLICTRQIPADHLFNMLKCHPAHR